MVKEAIKSEKMTLDDAIKHTEKVADECEVKARLLETPHYTKKSMEKYANAHRQLAEWLKELKELRKERIELKKENVILHFMLRLYEEDDEPDWIPVEEELPEERGRYLVCFKDNGILPCRVDICNYGAMLMDDDKEPHWYIVYDDFDVDVDDEVEAWMKLPDPCEE